MSLDFSCDIQMVRSEFGVNNMKAWIHPALSTVQTGGGGGVVMMWGIFLLAHFGPLSTNWASFKRHALLNLCYEELRQFFGKRGPTQY